MDNVSAKLDDTASKSDLKAFETTSKGDLKAIKTSVDAILDHLKPRHG